MTEVSQVLAWAREEINNYGSISKICILHEVAERMIRCKCKFLKLDYKSVALEARQTCQTPNP